MISLSLTEDISTICVSFSPRRYVILLKSVALVLCDLSV
jgi:hypothetical protein